jgi:hypothetical protein
MGSLRLVEQFHHLQSIPRMCRSGCVIGSIGEVRARRGGHNPGGHELEYHTARKRTVDRDENREPPDPVGQTEPRLIPLQARCVGWI